MLLRGLRWNLRRQPAERGQAAEEGPVPVGRRGMLRVFGAAAITGAGAALVGMRQPDKASAVTTIFNGGTSTTASAEGDNTAGGPGLVGNAGSTATPSLGPIGVYGTSSDTTKAGVAGNSTGGGVGVMGTTSSTTSAAVEGDNLGGGIGVQGTNTSDFDASVEGHNVGAGGGIFGTTATLGFGAVEGSHLTNGAGVTGFTTSSSADESNAAVMGNNSGSGAGVAGINMSGGGIGVFGFSNSTGNANPGVFGVNSAGGPAIVGFSPTGDGFSAVTATGVGCFGGASGSGTGVVAFSNNSTGLLAQTLGGSGQNAGVFAGNVVITGSLTVQGAKSAAVRGADGTLKRLYSLESPESWFEDFGSGQLSGGSATIQLEQQFAGVVHGNQYHVFLTPQGDCNGLYASNQNPNRFTVQETQGGTSNVSFSYRIVAKRKDIEGARLEHVPDVTIPSAPSFPTAPNTPSTPKRRGNRPADRPNNH